MRRNSAEKQKGLWKQASFTVEASVIFPVILFIVVIVVNLSIEQYQSVETYAQKMIQMEEYDPIPVIKAKAWLAQKGKNAGEEDAS